MLLAGAAVIWKVIGVCVRSQCRSFQVQPWKLHSVTSVTFYWPKQVTDSKGLKKSLSLVRCSDNVCGHL